MKRFAKRLSSALAGAGLAGWMAMALGAEPPPATVDHMLQQELRQQQIKTATTRVSEQLDAILAEFERNGIGGEDVKALKAIRAVLGKLTAKEMEKVIALLQEARGVNDPAASANRAADAYAGQKAIITQLHQLLLEYQRQQALYELSVRFKEFARRESDYMWAGVWLAKKTEGKAYNLFDEGQKTELKVQQTDQETLKDEAAPVLARLERFTREITDGYSAERARTALQQAKSGGLLPALDGAAEQLKSARLLSATGNEKKARDQFREIAALLTLSQGEVEALRQAIRELDQAIDTQRQLRADTRKMEKDEAAKLEIKQADVLDTTDLIRHDLESLAPVAVEQLAAAGDKMQEARSALSSVDETKKKREKAAANQSDALSKLAQARRALEEQLARAEAQSSKPENALAATKELQEQVNELIKDQEQLKEETAAADPNDLPAKAPKQGELRDKAQELQQQASAQASAAARSIGEGGNQMQKAQNSLAKAKPDERAQQAAIDALQAAAQQLAQDIARLEAAQQELAEMTALLEKLRAIIEEQQRLQMATAKEAIKPESPPLQGISSAQEKLGNDTGQLQQQASAPNPEAAAHLGDAKGHMTEARNELDKPAPKAAQPKQTEALVDLYAAKKELENRIAQLQNLLGLAPDDKAKALADAAAIIEQAQKDVSQALGEMRQSPPGLLEWLQQQQQQIASALGQMTQTTSASKPVNQAHKAADQAAQQLAQSNLPAAIASMTAAQQAIQDTLQADPPAPAGSQGDLRQNGGSEADPPSLPELSRQQTKVKTLAEELLATQQKAPAAAMQKAAQLLDQAGDAVGPLAAGKLGALPASAQSALQSAEGSLIDGAAQASAGQNSPAQQSAASASQSLAQALAALALAQAGLGSDAALASAEPGQGQGQKPGPGQGKGPPQAGGTPSPQGDGREGNWDGRGGADGPRRNTLGPGQFTGLPARDRAAIQQSQSEKYPQEYGPLVEQYLKNLSDQTGQK